MCHRALEGSSLDLVTKYNTFPHQGGAFDTVVETIISNCLPREGRGEFPRVSRFRKLKPFDQYLHLSFITAAIVEDSLKYEFRTLLNFVAHLEDGLCRKGTGPLGIPRRWCGGTSDMVTAHCEETPRALHQKPMSIGL